MACRIIADGLYTTGQPSAGTKPFLKNKCCTPLTTDRAHVKRTGFISRV